MAPLIFEYLNMIIAQERMSGKMEKIPMVGFGSPFLNATKSNTTNAPNVTKDINIRNTKNFALNVYLVSLPQFWQLSYERSISFPQW